MSRSLHRGALRAASPHRSAIAHYQPSTRCSISGAPPRPYRVVRSFPQSDSRPEGTGSVAPVDEPNDAGLSSAEPSTLARTLALLAILVAGASGGLIGHAVTDLQCADSCPALAGSMGLVGAVLAAAGVAVVAVLSLRAMAEWQATERQQAARDRHPVD